MKNIGIIEETKVLQLRVKKLLEKNGFDEIFAFGHDIFRSINIKNKLKNVDIFIIDLDNNEIASEEMIKKVIEYTSDQRVIIALTAISDSLFLKNMISLGCNDFLLKPFNDEKLILKVRRNLGLGKMNDFYEDFTYTDHSIEDNTEIEFKWFEGYSIGVKEIDLEHKELIEVYQRLYNLMKKGKGYDFYQAIVKFLQEYVNKHFANEEALQKKIGYEYYEEHHKIHESFKESLKQIIDDHQSKEIDDKDLIKINLFLKDWLMHHILIEDHKIGEFIKSKKSE